mgnify:CR=1 FL=1|jgi:hypothetical protein
MTTNTPQSVWNYDLLWAKAVLYMGRALEMPRDSELFPFWSSLALEFVARASLAYLSPTLLAEAGDQDGRHLLHALGIEPKVKGYVPKSIQISDVLARCKQIVPAFTEDMETFSRGFFNKRNEELHSGATPFSSLPNHSWLPRFTKRRSFYYATKKNHWSIWSEEMKLKQRIQC